MTKRLLPLIPGGLVVEQVLPEPDRITVVARSRLPGAACPDCRASSSRVHSRYERRLADLPWQGRPVAVRLRARRFFCAEPACAWPFDRLSRLVFAAFDRGFLFMRPREDPSRG